MAADKRLQRHQNFLRLQTSVLFKIQNYRSTLTSKWHLHLLPETHLHVTQLM